MSAITERFLSQKTSLTREELSFLYDIPIRMVTRICDKLHSAGFVNYVILDEGKTGISLALDPDDLSIGHLLSKLDETGNSNFIPRFGILYKDILEEIQTWISKSYDTLNDILIKDITLPEDLHKDINRPLPSFLKNPHTN